MKQLLLFVLLMVTLSVNCQNVNNEIEVTSRDIGVASNSKDVHSASINGQTYYYVTIKDKPNFAIIVAKKGAYKEFKEVVLPETFTSDDGAVLTIVGIGNRAFQKCKQIKKVHLPGTVKIIGNEAFYHTDVEDLSLKEGLVKIGSSAFYNNDLKDIHIPDGVEEIGETAFYCYKSTIFQRSGSGTLYIPNSVHTIGDKAFAMTRNGYGVWFNSKREILCLPDYVDLDNCKDFGISRDPVEKYLNKK